MKRTEEKEKVVLVSKKTSSVKTGTAKMGWLIFLCQTNYSGGNYRHCMLRMAPDRLRKGPDYFLRNVQEHVAYGFQAFKQNQVYRYSLDSQK
jgi:hypothetical protein